MVPADFDDSVALCVLLWAHPGRADALAAYENDVLQLLGVHGAALLSRVRVVDVAEGAPTEVHVIRFPSQSRFDAYMADPARLAMAERRDTAIARTEIHAVAVVTD